MDRRAAFRAGAALLVAGVVLTFATLVAPGSVLAVAFVYGGIPLAVAGAGLVLWARRR